MATDNQDDLINDANDGLTDEERAALEEDIGDEDIEHDPDAAPAAKADDEDDEDEAPSRDDGAAVAEEDAPAPVREPAPILNVALPEDFESKMGAIKTEKDALLQQFQDGDIDVLEFNSKLDGFNRQERELEAIKIKADISAEMRREQARVQWESEIEEFVTQTQGGIYASSKLAWMALDVAVREVGSDPANASLTGKQVLQKAHERVSKELGWESAKPAKQQDKPAKQKAEIPPSLGKMPAAEMTDAGEGRFAALDRLMDADPLKFEAALAKLSAAERDDYLASR